jgi:hypothetical protein
MNPLEENKQIGVIYIMGSGKSGSTILNMVLGMHKGVYGPGELNNIIRINNSDFHCSCNENVINCEFWSQVINTLKKELGEDGFKNFLRQIQKFENFKSPKAWTQALYPGKNPDQDYLSYQKNTLLYFRTILELQEKRIIVDSSKNPLRALQLSRNPGISLTLIHLVRDGRAVAWSIQRTKKLNGLKRHIFKSAVFWSTVNWQSDLVRSRTKSNLKLKYEEFSKDPSLWITRICNLANIESTALSNMVKSEFEIQENHIIGGSLIRKEKKTLIEPRETWKENLSFSKKLQFRIYTLFSLLKYGY